MSVEQRYAGHWSTRKLRLLPDEELVSSTMCFRRVFAGWIVGMLHLTSARLLWTPSWFQFGFGKLTIDREAVKDVAMNHPGWFRSSSGSWRLNIEHDNRVEGFVFFGREHQQLDQAGALLRAIKQWTPS